MDYLSYPFMQRALLICLFTAVICAVSGTLVVVNRNAFLTGGVAHASYGGIGLAIFAGLSPIWGAIVVAAGMGALLAFVRNKDEHRADALVSALWAAGMAGGILLSDLTPGYTTDFQSFLFGSILLVSASDVLATGLFALISLILVTYFYRTLLVTSADQEYAATLGIDVRRVNLVMLVLLCISVVLLLRVSGLIMVMALLSIPADIARSRAKTLLGSMVGAGLITIFSTLAGMFAAVWLNLTPGAVIVAMLALMYLVNMVLLRR